MNKKQTEGESKVDSSTLLESLKSHVENLERRAKTAEGLAGTIIATLTINLARGTIVCTDLQGVKCSKNTDQLRRLVQNWQNYLNNSNASSATCTKTQENEMSDTRTEKLKRAGWTEGEDGTMHPPDATTPRTDACVEKSLANDGGKYMTEDLLFHARQLETELALAVEALKIVRIMIKDMGEFFDATDARLADNIVERTLAKIEKGVQP